MEFIGCTEAGQEVGLDGLKDRQTDELHKPMLSYLIHSLSLHLSPPPWEDLLTAAALT